MKVINIVVALIVKNKRILLEKRIYNESLYPASWTSPGGHVEKNETIEDALYRELNEELELKPINPKLLFNYVIEDYYKKINHFIFLIQDWDGEFKGSNERQKIQWFSFDDALNLKLPKFQKISIFRVAEELNILLSNPKIIDLDFNSSKLTDLRLL